MTMQQVAERAGVSVSTVSHVVNGTRRVAEQTSDQVREAIRATGYLHNHLARSLARASTQTLGVAISVLTNPYFGELVHAIDDSASDAGFLALLSDTREDVERERAVVEAMLGRRVDGLLLAPAPGDADLLDHLARRRTPTVLVDRRPDDRFDAVTPEGRQAVADLTRHLVDLGHRRVGLVSGLTGLTTTDDRVAGYREAMTSAGLPHHDLVVRGDSTVTGAEDAVDRLLEAGATGLVVANNAMTLGALRALGLAGRRVPDDVALVAYDDLDWAETLSPGLTTQAQDTTAMGRLAVELVLRRIADREAPVLHHVLPPTLRHRGSCGCTT